MTSNRLLPLGSPVPEFMLLDTVSADFVSPETYAGAPVLVVAFLSNHCPYVHHVIPAFVRLSEAAMEKGVAVVAISTSSVVTHPQDGPECMKHVALAGRYRFPYLYDEDHKAAKAFRASCTPEFFVFARAGRRPFSLTYHGRFDATLPPKATEPGAVVETATGNELMAAIDAALAGLPPIGVQHPSTGCSLKWGPGEEPEYMRQAVDAADVVAAVSAAAGSAREGLHLGGRRGGAVKPRGVHPPNLE